MYQNIQAEPQAYAVIKGSAEYPSIRGTLHMFAYGDGSIVLVEVRGIPEKAVRDSGGFLGLHIHEGERCGGDVKDAFADAGSHYNPQGLSHPQHAGDLPPLLCHHGYAWMEVYTARLTPEEAVKRTIVIHGMSDDFRSQPSGDAGVKIACGEIRRWEKKDS